jgi:hypothetical protein
MPGVSHSSSTHTGQFSSRVPESTRLLEVNKNLNILWITSPCPRITTNFEMYATYLGQIGSPAGISNFRRMHPAPRSKYDPGVTHDKRQLGLAAAIAALTMAAPRVCYATARSGSFFPAFGRLHPRFGTPVNAILLQTALALAVLFFGAFDRVLAYIIFSAVFFLALAASTLFRLPEPVKAWWYPAAPILFIALCSLIGLLILAHDPLPALAGVGIVLLGLPLRKFFGSRPVPLPLASEES